MKLPCEGCPSRSQAQAEIRRYEICGIPYDELVCIDYGERPRRMCNIPLLKDVLDVPTDSLGFECSDTCSNSALTEAMKQSGITDADLTPN